MLTPQVWQYLEQVWQEGQETTGDPVAAVGSVWASREQAAAELVFSVHHVSNCEEDQAAVDELVVTSEDFRVGGLPCCLPAMKSVLCDGLKAVAPETMELTQRLFSEADFALRADIVFIWGNMGEHANHLSPKLIEILNSQGTGEAGHTLRCAAVWAFGNVGDPSDDVIDALSQIASALDEPQSLRSYCIEALMDLGPAAARASPVLERILRDESEDEDLRNFAWASLKSVTEKNPEHGCGGTVAEHMRTLYTTTTRPKETK